MDIKKKLVKVSAPPPPTIEYDLDTSKGLMPEIQLLIAPPVLEDSVKKKKVIEKRPRRPRGAINRDTCDFCKEGGDLLCCDKCAAAFHLLCYEPPLTEDDVPTGEWICSECTAKKKASPLSMIPDGYPMKGLLKRAIENNNIAFELPTKIARRLPSTTTKKPKPRDTRNHKKSGPENETRLVPLPANLCYTCKRNSKKFALVQCDYCPLLFHLDCLDPPLTSLPVSKWMCPIHVEHRADLRLVSNLSLSTRIKLWDKFNGPVRQDTVKLKFLNKINKPSPPFRRKTRFLKRSTTSIPGMVWKQYKMPPPRLPCITDPIPDPIFDEASVCIDQESTAWLSKLVPFLLEVNTHREEVKKTTFNDEVITECDSSEEADKRYASSGSVPSTVTDASTMPGVSTVSGASTGNAPSTVTEASTTPGVLTVSGTSTVSDTTEVLGSRKEPDVTNPPKDIKDISATAKASVTTDSNPVIDSSEPQKIPLRSVLGIADGSPRLIKIDDGKKTILTSNKPAIIKTRLVPCTTIGSVLNPTCTATGMMPTEAAPKTTSVMPEQAKVPEKIAYSAEDLLKVIQYVSAEDPTQDDIQLNEMEDTLMRLCAYQFLKQLPIKKEPPSDENAIQAPAPAPEVRARAVLVPINGVGEPVTMPYRSMHLGLGADMDVCLSKFGHCNFVSAKHATIFYDEYTKQYELLNYSCHGTTVDNVHYSSFVNRKKNISSNAFSNAVHRLYNSTPRLQAQAVPDLNSEDIEEPGIECDCLLKKYSDLVPPSDCTALEGSALLHHGSYIRCGCLQFVFSITEYGYNLVNSSSIPLATEDKPTVKKAP